MVRMMRQSLPRIGRKVLCLAVPLLLFFGTQSARYLYTAWNKNQISLRSEENPGSQFSTKPSEPKREEPKTFVNGKIATNPGLNITNHTVTKSFTGKIATNPSLNLTNPTVTKNSVFYIKNPRDSYKICDVLEICIEARDGDNVRKSKGGDMMWPYIRSMDVQASASADELIDHGDGSYTALFTLTWAGMVEPVVWFVYSGEQISVLANIWTRVPYRNAYDGIFKANGKTETTPCHAVKAIPYIAQDGDIKPANASVSEICDYSNTNDGMPWYCLKPKTLPCSAYAQIMRNDKRAIKYAQTIRTKEEKALVTLKSPGFLTNTGPVKKVEVAPKVKGKDTDIDTCLSLPECLEGVPPKLSKLSAGFYYKDSWRSKVCREMAFTTQSARKCLRGKNLYFYGDSTDRQLLSYLLDAFRPTMREPSSDSRQRTGYQHCIDTANNITLTYHMHAYPMWDSRAKDVFKVIPVVNLINALPGGPNTVVVISMWAHFTGVGPEYYRRRLEGIKAAILRLHQRGSSPSSIIFKSGNTIDTFNQFSASEFNQYYIREVDRVMRELFIGMSHVTILDAWEMTICHRLGRNLHPHELIIREEVKMLLNFVCRPHFV